MTTINQLQTPQSAKTFLSELSEEYRKNLITAIESNAQEEKQNKLLSIQQEILSKPNMQDHHRYVLTKISNNLVENNHQAELEQLNKWIDFTEKWGLIVHTSSWDIKFSSKSVNLNDIKDIAWIEEGKNILTKNTTTWLEWFWVNSDAIKIIKDTGKRIFTDEQYLDIQETFSLLNNLYKCNEVFFDVLWLDQYGIFSIQENARRGNMNRFLHTNNLGTVYDASYNNWVMTGYDNCYSGIRFIED